jgi:SAM-dependent methyltransferase
MRAVRLSERIAASLNQLPTAIYDTFPAPLFGRVLVVASNLGLFELLDRNFSTPADIARQAAIPQHSASLILNALESGGYVAKRSDGAFTLTRQARKWLLPTSPHSIRNFLAYIAILHRHWMNLEETLLSGKPAATYVETFTETEWQTYTLGMMELARLFLPFVMARLKLPANPRSMIDLGGSHGMYTIELCQRYPSIYGATIADYPEVLSTTASIVRQHKLDDRITLLPCDLTTVTFDADSTNIVLAFNIVHGFTADVNRRIVMNAANALRPGGVLYVLDQVRVERSRGVDGLIPAMVGINLLNEIGGSVYTIEEIRSWCQAAGLKDVRHVRLNIPGVSLVSARKQLAR